MSPRRPTRRQWLVHGLTWVPVCLLNVLGAGQFVTASVWEGSVPVLDGLGWGFKALGALAGLALTWWSGVRLGQGPRP